MRTTVSFSHRNIYDFNLFKVLFNGSAEIEFKFYELWFVQRQVEEKLVRVKVNGT